MDEVFATLASMVPGSKPSQKGGRAALCGTRVSPSTGDLSTGDVDELRGNRGDDILRAQDDEGFAYFDENRRTGRHDTVGARRSGRTRV